MRTIKLHTWAPYALPAAFSFGFAPPSPAFAPQHKTELQDAVDACTKESPVDDWDSSDPRFIVLTSDSKVKKRVLVAGTGDCPRTGDRVVVHYTGTFRKTGAVFDSSRTKTEPFAFHLGGGEVTNPLIFI